MAPAGRMVEDVGSGPSPVQKQGGRAMSIAPAPLPESPGKVDYRDGPLCVRCSKEVGTVLDDRTAELGLLAIGLMTRIADTLDGTNEVFRLQVSRFPLPCEKSALTRCRISLLRLWRTRRTPMRETMMGILMGEVGSWRGSAWGSL